MNPAVRVTAIAAKDAHMLERREIGGAEPAWQTRIDQSLEHVCRDALADRTRVEQLLEVQLRINASLQNSGAIQVQEAVDEHLRAAVEAFLERRGAAEFRDSRPGAGQQPTLFEHLPPDSVLSLPELQAVHDGVSQLADADLQRAAVAHGRARVQTDGVLHTVQGEIGRAVQVEVVARVIHQVIELAFSDLGIAEHEGELSMHLADHYGIVPGALGLVQLR